MRITGNETRDALLKKGTRVLNRVEPALMASVYSSSSRRNPLLPRSRMSLMMIRTLVGMGAMMLGVWSASPAIAAPATASREMPRAVVTLTDWLDGSWSEQGKPKPKKPEDPPRPPRPKPGPRDGDDE